MTRRRLAGYFLGRRDYRSCLALQEQLHAARVAGEVGDTVLFVEHPAVITLGRGAHAENLLASRARLAELGVDVAEIGRGGDVTLHAPGQLVCYPILDLAPDRKDVRRYVKDLAEVMRQVAQAHGVSAGAFEQHIGLWANRGSPRKYVGPESSDDLVKLGAIGVRISRWITMHGFALNLSPDMRLFSLIVPCGIREFGVGSLAELMDGPAPSVELAATQAFAALIRVLDGDAAASSWVRGEPPATISTFPNGVRSDAP
ncbi:MAG TPA: lipoyl(octanoyl) transferase LipB [Polyangiaceae bacterium]|nr:lipoyl(octanoyl) transferase LipB [Polyangiaceae bacterium]